MNEKRITLSEEDKKVLKDIHKVFNKHTGHKKFFVMMGSYEQDEVDVPLNAETNHTFLTTNMNLTEFDHLISKSLLIVSAKMKHDLEKRDDQ